MMVMQDSNRNPNSTWRPQAVLGRLQKALVPAGWQQEGLLGMRGSSRLLPALLLALLLLGAYLLVYATGGTTYPYLHIVYLPIVLAAFWFFVPGGLISAVFASLLMGPLMPLSVMTGEAQSTMAWLYRSGMFLLVGGVIGHLSFLSSQRLQAVSSSLHNLASAHAKTLKTFAALVALRDEETGGHCERVAYNARAVGERLGLSQQELKDLYWAGVLHDLGKVATPASILLKDGKLSDEEYAEIQKHAALGCDILMEVSSDYHPIALGVRHHHEWFDGNGYPDGLAGDSIPLFGRILAVVDVFEALTSQRPYRGPVPPELALQHLQLRAGMQFDPEIVRLFSDLYDLGIVSVAGEEQLTAEEVMGEQPEHWARSTDHGHN